jgi:hypothetical protein
MIAATNSHFPAQKYLMDYLIKAYSVLCKEQTESWDTGWINFDLQSLK